MGSIIIISISKRICERNQKFTYFVAFLGRISIGIYIINSYMNSYITIKITKNFLPNYVIWIIETIVSIIIYITIIKVIQKFPRLDSLLFGGRTSSVLHNV